MAGGALTFYGVAKMQSAMLQGESPVSRLPSRVSRLLGPSLARPLFPASPSADTLLRAVQVDEYANSPKNPHPKPAAAH